MGTAIPTAADVLHVREVSLLATADLAFWRGRLAPERLEPVESAGRAQILIIAAGMRFAGVRFREVSISILARRSAQEGARLLLAFNTCRLFAFLERAVFSTPYFHAGVAVNAARPASIRLETGDTVALEAAMGEAGEDVPAAAGGWKGTVFLPWDGRGEESARKVFVAQISGLTRTRDFDPSRDTLAIRPVSGREVFQHLVDSGLAGRQWSVREDARHVKSKTVTAADAPAQ